VCSQGNTPKTVSRLVQARPARSLLMPLLTVGPRGYQETPYSTVQPQSSPHAHSLVPGPAVINTHLERD